MAINKICQKEKNLKKIFDRKNMLFSGTNVLFGNAIAVVTAIGEETQLGVIK